MDGPSSPQTGPDSQLISADGSASPHWLDSCYGAACVLSEPRLTRFLFESVFLVLLCFFSYPLLFFIIKCALLQK